MKIYDCTTFFDEKIMMDVRFNILDKYVNKFIVVESIYSHSGIKKKLNFEIQVEKTRRRKTTPPDLERQRVIPNDSFESSALLRWHSYSPNFSYDLVFPHEFFDFFF